MVCGFWRCKSYVDIRRGSLLRWCQMRVQSSKIRVFSFAISSVWSSPTGFTYQNLHGFARFPGNSMALVDESVQLVVFSYPLAHSHFAFLFSFFAKVIRHFWQRRKQYVMGVLFDEVQQPIPIKVTPNYTMIYGANLACLTRRWYADFSNVSKLSSLYCLLEGLYETPSDW